MSKCHECLKMSKNVEMSRRQLVIGFGTQQRYNKYLGVSGMQVAFTASGMEAILQKVGIEEEEKKG